MERTFKKNMNRVVRRMCQSTEGVNNINQQSTEGGEVGGTQIVLIFSEGGGVLIFRQILIMKEIIK